MRAIKDANLHSEYHCTYLSRAKLNIAKFEFLEMKQICILFLFLALWGFFKGLSVEAHFDQSCQMSHELEEECSVYAHQVTKPMLGYFEQVTRKIDNHSAEIERKNEQIKHLEYLNEQIREKGDSMMKLQLENMNYKLKEADVILELKQKMEQLPNKVCEYQNNELKGFKSKQIELQKELESKNEQIKQLQMEISTFKSRGDSMTAMREELKKLLLDNLWENEMLKALETKISSNAEKLFTFESKLVSKYKKTNQLEAEVKSCIEIDSSGVYSVIISNNYTLEVLCNTDIAGPGWTVIQQRINGRVDFNTDWDFYRNGFGAFWEGDFFLGLENIYRLTTEQRHELYIHMERSNGSTYYAKYDDFAISDEENYYKLIRLGEFSGSTTDKLRNHKDMPFTTRDYDSYDAAAEYYHGGWWYYNCASCNLNGKYFKPGVEHEQSVFWEDFTSLKQVKMMIRPKY